MAKSHGVGRQPDDDQFTRLGAVVPRRHPGSVGTDIYPHPYAFDARSHSYADHDAYIHGNAHLYPYRDG